MVFGPWRTWLGSSLDQIEGWTTVRESYSLASEQGTLPGNEALEHALHGDLHHRRAVRVLVEDVAAPTRSDDGQLVIQWRREISRQ